MFKAIRLTKDGDTLTAEVGQMRLADLPDGDVTVAISHSTINYKDGLAITGRGPVVRSYPMVPGIDFAGVVEDSEHPGFKAGDPVVVNGWGMGETRWGGLGEKARVSGDWLVPLPGAFSAAQAMAIGTAGYTAALSVLALEEAGIAPDLGDVLVTGASGGVGGVAIALLAKRGYRVVAVTGRPDQEPYLKGLGAAEIVDRAEFTKPARPLGKERWAAAVDAAGSHVLANVLSQVRYGGAVAACGLAAGMDLPTSVAPFILRGVSLLGIDSVYAPLPKRLKAWDVLAHDLAPEILDSMTEVIGLAEAIPAGARILDGQVRGRLVVDIAG